MESVDTYAIIGSTATSVTLPITGIGLLILHMNAGSVCSISIAKKVLQNKTLKRYNNCEKQYRKDQQTIKPFDKLYTKSVQDNLFDKSEYESLCNIFTK